MHGDVDTCADAGAFLDTWWRGTRASTYLLTANPALGTHTACTRAAGSSGCARCARADPRGRASTAAHDAGRRAAQRCTRASTATWCRATSTSAPRASRCSWPACSTSSSARRGPGAPPCRGRMSCCPPTLCKPADGAQTAAVPVWPSEDCSVHLYVPPTREGSGQCAERELRWQCCESAGRAAQQCSRSAGTSSARRAGRVSSRATASGRARARAQGLRAADVDAVVTNCCTFAPTPSFSALLVNRFGMRPGTLTYSLGGMGCSAGLIALDLAHQLMRARARPPPRGRRRPRLRAACCLLDRRTGCRPVWMQPVHQPEPACRSASRLPGVSCTGCFHDTRGRPLV